MAGNSLPPMTRYQVHEDQYLDLDNWFNHHPPRPGTDQVERYEQIRSQGGMLARRIMQLTPSSHEQAVAVEKIREAVMWANAAIAVNE